MPINPTADQQSQIMSHAIALAFLLGAVAAYISIFLTRMTMVVDRIRSLNDITDEDAARVGLRSDIPRLKHRAALWKNATYPALQHDADLLLGRVLFPRRPADVFHDPLGRCLGCLRFLSHPRFS